VSLSVCRLLIDRRMKSNCHEKTKCHHVFAITNNNNNMTLCFLIIVMVTVVVMLNMATAFSASRSARANDCSQSPASLCDAAPIRSEVGCSASRLEEQKHRQLKHQFSDFLFAEAHKSWAFALGINEGPPPLKTLHSSLFRIWSKLCIVEPSYVNAIIVDIGAGDFSGGQQIFISDVIEFGIQFKSVQNNVTIFALEPGHQAARRLHDLSMFHEISIQIIEAAASNKDAESVPLYCFRRRDEENMFSLRPPAGDEERLVKQTGCDVPVDYVQTVRLDTMFDKHERKDNNDDEEEENHQHNDDDDNASWTRMKNQTKIFYAKIDVEGWDFEVIRGAESLLTHHMLDAFSFEYGLLWNPVFHMQIYVDEHSYERPISYNKLPSPTLREVTDWLDDRDFEVYMIMNGVCLPVSGEKWWQDGFEICANPKRVLGIMWCLVDMLALRKNSAIQKLFLDECNQYWKWHPPFNHPPPS